tara:strand:+ start:5060 stop:5218 length:159 start_codon:yes stop_codon:yes gene_type:complete
VIIVEEMNELLKLTKKQLATMIIESNEIIDALALKFGMDFIMQIYFNQEEEE